MNALLFFLWVLGTYEAAKLVDEGRPVMSCEKLLLVKQKASDEVSLWYQEFSHQEFSYLTDYDPEVKENLDQYHAKLNQIDQQYRQFCQPNPEADTQ